MEYIFKNKFGPCGSVEMNAITSLGLMKRKGTKWQRRALIEARDEIRQKTRVIEQLIKSISEMKSNLENKETVDDDNDDGVVRKFEEFYV